MALVTRFGRLLKADMHAVLDRMEEPDIVLRQAIREMEDEVAQRVRRLKALEHERATRERRITEIDDALDHIANQLDLCFEADNETLARTLLRRRLEKERLRRQLTAAQEHAIGVAEELAALIDEQRERLQTLCQKAAAFEIEAATPHGDVTETDADAAITEADVDLALLEERRRRRPS